MNSINYAPPWLDLETGEYYGPKTSATFARHMAQHRDWAYNKPRTERPEAPLVHLYFAECWQGLPESEMLVYRLVYVLRMSLSEAAESEGLNKGSVKSYVKRLRDKASKWDEMQG